MERYCKNDYPVVFEVDSVIILQYTNYHKKDLKLMKAEMFNFRGKVLDIGGRDFTDRLGFVPGDEYICLDMIKSKNISVISDAHQLPFKKESFDCIICNAVLEHVTQPQKILAEAYRVLKPKGILWVSVPFLQHIHSDPYDFRRFTNYGLQHEVENAGFIIINSYGAHGIIDSVEYLLFSGILWKVKDNSLKNILDIIYLLVLGFGYIIFKFLGLIFSSVQKKDIHHSVAFSVIAKKE